MPGGRPTKLTNELEDKIIKDIKEGIPPGTAAQIHGISHRTYERWMKRGREAKRKTIYREFCHKIEAAKSFAEKKHLHKIMDSKDWKAQKYLLTLLNKDYALPDKIEVKSEVKADVKSENKSETVFKRVDKLTEFIEEGNKDGSDELPSQELDDS